MRTASCYCEILAWIVQRLQSRVLLCPESALAFRHGRSNKAVVLLLKPFYGWISDISRLAFPPWFPFHMPLVSRFELFQLRNCIFIYYFFLPISCCRESPFPNWGRWTRSKQEVGIQRGATAAIAMMRMVVVARGLARWRGRSPESPSVSHSWPFDLHILLLCQQLTICRQALKEASQCVKLHEFLKVRLLKRFVLNSVDGKWCGWVTLYFNKTSSSLHFMADIIIVIIMVIKDNGCHGDIIAIKAHCCKNYCSPEDQ